MEKTVKKLKSFSSEEVDTMINKDNPINRKLSVLETLI